MSKGIESGPSSGWGSPSILVVVAEHDPTVDKPLVYTASSSPAGTLPTRHEISTVEPSLLVDDSAVLPPWKEGGESHVFVYLPCQAFDVTQYEGAPAYLAGFEEAKGKPAGEYTGVYRSQYQFGQGSELMVLELHNATDGCSVNAYRAIKRDEKVVLEKVEPEPLDFRGVFTCEVSTDMC